MSADSTAGLRTSQELVEPLILEAERGRRNPTKDELIQLLKPAIPELAKSYKIRLMAIKAAKSIQDGQGTQLDDARARAEAGFMQFNLDPIPLEAIRGFVAECTEEKLSKYKKDSLIAPGSHGPKDPDGPDEEVKTTALQRSVDYLRRLIAQLSGDKTRPVLAQILLDALNNNVTVDARLRATVQEVVRLSEQNKTLWREYSAVAAGVLPTSCQGAVAIAAARAFCNEVALRYCQVLLEINHGTRIDLKALRAVIEDTVEANLTQALSGSLASFCKATETITKHLNTSTQPTPTPVAKVAIPVPTTQPSVTSKREKKCFWCQQVGHEVSKCPTKLAGGKKVKPMRAPGGGKRNRETDAPPPTETKE